MFRRSSGRPRGQEWRPRPRPPGPCYLSISRHLSLAALPCPASRAHAGPACARTTPGLSPTRSSCARGRPAPTRPCQRPCAHVPVSLMLPDCTHTVPPAYALARRAAPVCGGPSLPTLFLFLLPRRPSAPTSGAAAGCPRAASPRRCRRPPTNHERRPMNEQNASAPPRAARPSTVSLAPPRRPQARARGARQAPARGAPGRRLPTGRDAGGPGARRAAASVPEDLGAERSLQITPFGHHPRAPHTRRARAAAAVRAPPHVEEPPATPPGPPPRALARLCTTFVSLDLKRGSAGGVVDARSVKLLYLPCSPRRRRRSTTSIHGGPPHPRPAPGRAPTQARTLCFALAGGAPLRGGGGGPRIGPRPARHPSPLGRPPQQAAARRVSFVIVAPHRRRRQRSPPGGSPAEWVPAAAPAAAGTTTRLRPTPPPRPHRPSRAPFPPARAATPAPRGRMGPLQLPRPRAAPAPPAASILSHTVPPFAREAPVRTICNTATPG
jgi:hypothetical protein